jgi:DNA-binding transcriptional ArsR family regulator
MTRLVRMVRALADPTRVRILQLLEKREELCVCEIMTALGLTQPTTTADITSACTGITSVAFTFTPAVPKIGQPVDLAAAITGGTAPITYTWARTISRTSLRRIGSW